MKSSQKNDNLLGNNLKHLREINDETLKQVGNDVFASHTTIKNYESGIRMPDPEKMKSLSQHYGITIDQLLYTDLSVLEKFDFSPQNVEDFFKLWNTIVPLVVSDTAMKNPDFQKGYNKCNSIIDHFMKNETVTWLVVNQCFDSFIKAAESNIVEAKANILWLIILEWTQIVDSNMINVYESIFYTLKKPKNNLKKLIKSTRQVSDDVLKRRNKFVYKWDDVIYGIIKELKNDKKWAELGDYYIALKFLFGITDTGYSFEMNETIGVQILLTLVEIENKYACNTLEMIDSI